MATSDQVLETVEIQNITKKPERGSKKDLLEKLRVFSNGAKHNSDPFEQKRVMTELVLEPGFGADTTDREKLDGFTLLDVRSDNKDYIDGIREALSFLTKIAEGSQSVAVGHIFDGKTGKITPYLPRNGDTLIILISPEDGGVSGSDNYLEVRLFWEGKGSCVEKPVSGRGEELKKELGEIKDRLENRTISILMAELTFTSRPQAQETIVTPTP